MTFLSLHDVRRLLARQRAAQWLAERARASVRRALIVEVTADTFEPYVEQRDRESL